VFVQQGGHLGAATADVHLDRPALEHLLARPLPDPLMRAVLAALNAAESADAQAMLHRFRGWEDSTFEKQYEPLDPGPVSWLPLYSVYVLAEKLYDGRETTAGDWVEAAVDVGTTFAPVPGAKAGGVAAVQGSKQVAKVAGRQAAAAALKKTGVEVAKRSLRGGVKAAEQLAARELGREATRLAVSHTLSRMQATLKAFLIALDRRSTLEITSAIRFLEGYLGRRSVDRLLRLNAQLFLRADGRVCLRLGRFAFEWAKDKAKDRLKDYFMDKLRAVLDGDDTAARDASRQQLSAWWLLSGYEV
jgi:hypothetical protein